jgi:hypothetical protein
LQPLEFPDDAEQMAQIIPMVRTTEEIYPGAQGGGKLALAEGVPDDRMVVVGWNEYGFIWTFAHLLLLLGWFLDTFNDELSIEVDGTHKVSWDKWVFLSLGKHPFGRNQL